MKCPHVANLDALIVEAEAALAACREVTEANAGNEMLDAHHYPPEAAEIEMRLMQYRQMRENRLALNIES